MVRRFYAYFPRVSIKITRADKRYLPGWRGLGYEVRSPRKRDIPQQAQEPGIQRRESQQIQKNNPARADQLARLVDRAAAPHHNLAVLLGKDDILIRGKFLSHDAAAAMYHKAFYLAITFTGKSRVRGDS